MSVRLVARLLWLAPLLLLGISVSLFLSVRSLHQTLSQGMATTAEVVEWEVVDRAEATYAHLVLRAGLPDGQQLERTVPLPITMVKYMVKNDSLAVGAQMPVRVLPGAEREIVIEAQARAQQRLPLILAFLSLASAIGLGVAVGAWNRYLARHGDPAERTVVE